MSGAKHAEASTNLSGIKLAEEGYKLANGVYFPCGVAPRLTPDQDAFAWSDATAVNTGDYTTIDFTLSGDVRFVYEVFVPLDPTSFEAGAQGDTDGDQTYILFAATNTTSPALTPEADYAGTLTGGIED